MVSGLGCRRVREMSSAVLSCSVKRRISLLRCVWTGDSSQARNDGIRGRRRRSTPAVALSCRAQRSIPCGVIAVG